MTSTVLGDEVIDKIASKPPSVKFWKAVLLLEEPW